MPLAEPLARTPQPNARGSSSRSVTIVGAGPGGLAAAILLARGGAQVRVVERLPHVGGRCSSIRANGFRFDLGPTFFLYPQVLQRIFRLVGLDLMKRVPMVRLDPQYKVVFGREGGEVNCTPDLERMAAEVRKISEHDAANIKRFIDDNRVKLDRFRPVLESPFMSWTKLLSKEMVKLLPLLRPWLSVDSELKRYFDDPRVRLAFTFQSKYLGMSPFNCPSLFSILSYLEYDFGVWHPIGGCSAVSEAMAEVARDLGVTFHLGEEVQQVLFEGRKAVGVATDQGEYRSDALVINADFSRAMRRLVPNHLRRRWTDKKIESKRFSCSTYMMYLGLDGPPPDMAHHTIYTSGDYIGNLTDIETNGRVSPDPSIYVQNPCITDETLAPKGQTSLYLLVPVPHRRDTLDWSVEGPRLREVALDQAEWLGVTDIRSRIRYEKIVTPHDWEHHYEVFKGATFNLAHNLGQMLHLRPRNRFEDLDQVYLVGGGTHPGSGLPVIYESARITSRILLNDFGLDTSWIEDQAPSAIPATV